MPRRLRADGVPAPFGHGHQRNCVSWAQHLQQLWQRSRVQDAVYVSHLPCASVLIVRVAEGAWQWKSEAKSQPCCAWMAPVVKHKHEIASRNPHAEADGRIASTLASLATGQWLRCIAVGGCGWGRALFECPLSRGNQTPALPAHRCGCRRKKPR